MARTLLHLLHSSDPATGGVVEAVRLLAAEHQRLGHRVEIATIEPPAVAGKRPLPAMTHALGPARPAGWGRAPALRRFLRDHARAYDTVFVHGLWKYHGVVAAEELPRLGVPYYVFPHGMLDPWFKNAYPLKHAKKLAYWIAAERKVLARAAGVLFTTEQERQLSRATFPLYQAREYICPLGLPRPACNLEEARSAFHAAYPALSGKRTVLFLSRIHPKKGLELLLSAFAAEFSKPPQRDVWQLVIAGPCEDVAYLQSLHTLAREAGLCGADAPGRVHFLPMLLGLEKWGALASAEAFILPSHQENFAVAAVEALSAGTPALVSDKVAIWREIEESGAGLAATDDLPGTRNLLQRLRDLPDAERAAWRNRAARAFSERFAIEAAAAHLLDITGGRTAPTPPACP